MGEFRLKEWLWCWQLDEPHLADEFCRGKHSPLFTTEPDENSEP